MSDGTGLSVANQSDLLALVSNVPVKYADEKSELAVTSSGQQFPYIILCGATTKVVQAQKIGIGHFALFQGKTFTDLGSDFVALFLKWRPKAMSYGDGVHAVYDPNSDEFAKIVEMADSSSMGYSYGPEFLVWLPDYGKFATYLLGNKTGRNESPNILGPLKEKGVFLCKQEAHFIEGRKNSWYGPRTQPYEHDIVLPDRDLLQQTLDKFANPPSSEVELDTEGVDDDRR